MSFRLQQINKTLHHELSLILAEFAKPEWGMITVSEVLVTPDLKTAKIWLSANPKAVKDLNSNHKDIYYALKPRLKFKHIPKMTFFEEDNQVSRVEQILEELHES